MTERKMATVSTIEEITPIKGADRIALAKVRGWRSVVSKDAFSTGDRVVYVEADGPALPLRDARFAFLGERRIAIMDGEEVHPVKTTKLRGTLSQGLIFALRDFPEIPQDAPDGTDVTERLNIKNWERAQENKRNQVNKAIAYGALPDWVARTSVERVQNLPPDFLCGQDANDWVATEKIDGTSTTFWFFPGEDRDFGVCSRNLDLIHDESSIYWKAFTQFDMQFELPRMLREINAKSGENGTVSRIAIQGELYGHGIGGSRLNPLNLPDVRFSLFNVILYGEYHDMYGPTGDERPYVLTRDEWPERWESFAVPVLNLPFPSTVDEAIEQADARTSTLANAMSEGVVWERTHDTTGEFRKFKAINNTYLAHRKGGS